MGWKTREQARAYAKKYRDAHPKECAAYSLKYRSPRMEEMRKKGRDYHAGLKLKVLTHYGPYCACCGEAENMFLTIDHVNGDGARHRREFSGRRSGSGFYSWLIRNNFPKGFQTLCYNCNVAKSRSVKCPHQRNVFKL